MYARLSIAAVVSLIFAAQSANAQLCAGAASFTTGRMQAGGQLLSNDDYSSYGVGLGVGNARGLFGGAQIANNDYDFVDESGLWLGASGGYQMKPSKTGFQVCPVASVGFGMGPDNIGGSETDLSVREISAGAIIGKLVHREGSLQVIPTGGLSFVSTKVTLDAPGASEDVSDTFFALNVGAGLVVNSVWTIRPMLSLPFGADDRDESISLNVSYNFGKRASSAARPPARRSR